MDTVILHDDGSAIGLTIPADIQARLGLSAGQTVTIIEIAGGFQVVKPTAARTDAELIDDVFREQGDALRTLAHR